MRDGRYVFLDWADSSLTHPFHTLAVTMRVLAWRHSLTPDAPELYRLRDLYLERFEGFASPSDLRVASEIALRTGTIQRALVGHRYYLGEPWVERDDSIPYDLKLFLANGPIGSWEP